MLTQETFLTSIGRARSAKGGAGVTYADGMPPFLSASNLIPFISDELRQATAPILFRTPDGLRAYGYKAELLPMVCEVYLSARDAKAATKQQEHIVKACD